LGEEVVSDEIDRQLHAAGKGFLVRMFASSNIYSNVKLGGTGGNT
jgi:hypothetical protein